MVRRTISKGVQRSPAEEALDAIRQHLGPDLDFPGNLTALEVARKTAKGRYADGKGLYLQVSSGGAKSWIFKYQTDRPPRRATYRTGQSSKPESRKRTQEMGLGSTSTVSLQAARVMAAAYRRLAHDGLDPIEERRRVRARAAVEDAKTVTFKEAARQYIAAQEAGWGNAKHREQWRRTLEMFAFPILGDLPVNDIDTGLVVQTLEPIWSKKHETASRLRGRIEAILDWARVRGYREGENPARWRGHLDKAGLSSPSDRIVAHHPALPYEEVHSFVKQLRAREGVAVRALEFTVLCATRTTETLGATWDEIDLAKRMWTIPGSRMKGGKEHRVPLSDRAIEIVSEMQAARDVHQPFVFPGGKRGQPLSNVAMLAVLKRMGRRDITVHGFRSSFKDWASEKTDYPNEMTEIALAHVVGSKVEAAYRRGAMVEKRRHLMNDWAGFCENAPPDTDNVIPLPTGRSQSTG
jgi:integrase